MKQSRATLLKKFLCESYKQSKKKSLLCFFAMLLLTLLNVNLPKILQMIIDDAINGNNLKLLICLGIIYLGSILIISLLKMLQNYNMSCIKTKLMLYYKVLLLKKLSKFSGSFYSNLKSGEVLNIVDNDIGVVESFGIDIVFDFISNILTAIFALYMLLKFQLGLFVVVFLIQIVIILFQTKFSRMLANRTREIREQAGKVYSLIEQYVSNILEVIISKTNTYFFKNYIPCERVFAKKGIMLDALFGVNSQIGIFLSSLITITIYLIGGYNIIKGELKLGQLIAFQQYTTMFIGPCMGLLKMNDNLQRLHVSLERIYGFLNKPSDIKQNNNGLIINRDIKTIEFKNVFFGYDEKKVLKNIKCSLSSGKVYAIVGSTGCGKSTFINLLYRLWDVDSGEILLNGININKYNLYSLRKNISIVSQNTFIIDDTIEKNLKLENSSISEAKCIEICKNIGIHDFIINLPEGYQTLVGEAGIKLSGGQRQRIAIVRMLIQSKNVLIFDEATSALDNITQNNILSNIKEYYKDKIVIMIAHRLSTIKNADKILVIQDGEISESGNHEQLMSIKREYYNLVMERDT